MYVMTHCIICARQGIYLHLDLEHNDKAFYYVPDCDGVTTTWAVVVGAGAVAPKLNPCRAPMTNIVDVVQYKRSTKYKIVIAFLEVYTNHCACQTTSIAIGTITSVGLLWYAL
jgi:hypothetical protein